MKKEKEPISITQTLKEHYAWVIAILTFLGVLSSSLIKLIDFIKNKYYFVKFGLNIKFYRYEEKGFLYEVVYATILLLAFGIAITCMDKMFKNIRKKETQISNLICFIALNIFLVFGIIAPTTIISFIIFFIIFLIIEFFVLILSRKLNEKSDREIEDSSTYNFKEEFIECLIIFYTAASLLVCSLVIYPTIFIDKTEFKIIDNQKAIVYTTNDYYLTLDCEEVGDSLVIYKGTETKINTENIHSKLVQYKNIILK